MTIVSDKNNYDHFLQTRFISGSFLQSSIWQKFLAKQKHNFWQLAVKDNDQIIAVCLFYENCLPLSRSYFYAPKGPVVGSGLNEQQKQEAVELILSKARDVTIDTKNSQEIFFKLEPGEESLILPGLNKVADVQPRDSWILDLSKDLQILLGEMHAKTRYNIALARRHGVKIRFSHDSKDMKYFLSLISKTASRNQITVHSDKYYNLLFETLVENQAGELALAEIDQQIVAANMMLRFGMVTTYLHGASDYKFRKYMAPQLLQWESIKRAKEHGFTKYDFWGIAPADNSKPNWGGITRFKKGFGGYRVAAPGTYDLIYDRSWYSMYKLSKILLRK